MSKRVGEIFSHFIHGGNSEANSGSGD